LIRQFIDSNVKLFTVNRIIQQPYLNLLFLFVLEPAE